VIQRDFNVARYYVHPKYNKSLASPQNDLALVVLVQTVPFNSFIKPICLGDSVKLTNETTCVVTGWGYMEYMGVLSHTLQQLGKGA